jgi:hypothetical protein
MRDRNGIEVYENQIVRVLNHPTELQENWMVVDFLGCTKDFVVQHFISHEIKIFPQKDIEIAF